MELARRLRSAWEAFRAFEAAKASPQHRRRPLYGSQSPDAAVQDAGLSLSEWGIWLDENHDIAIGILDDLVTNVVGVGIYTRPIPRIGGRENQDLAEFLSDLLETWARTPDVTGEIAMPELQRVSCRSWLRDGEFFAQHVDGNAAYRWSADEVRYRIEFLESAMVPLDTLAASDGERQGVYHDSWNRPTGYRVYLHNPNDYSGGMLTGTQAGNLQETKRVPAEQIIHCKFARRWPQTRGVPITHGIIRRLQNLKGYEDDEQIAARVAASMCAFIRRSPENHYEIKDEAFDNRPERMQAGRIFDDLLPGEEIGTIDTTRPNTGLGEYRSQMIRALAAGTGTRYSSIAKDYNGTYSAQRQELVEARPHYLRLRNYFIEKFVRPTYERWLRQAWIQGALPMVPSGTQFSDLARAEFIGPGLPWIDPKKEVEADALAVSSGFITREQVIINRGGDPRLVPEPEQPEPATVLGVVGDEDEDEDEESDSGTA